MERSKENGSNNSKNKNSISSKKDEDDEEEEDRKSPPAQEIRVFPKKGRFRSRSRSRVSREKKSLSNQNSGKQNSNTSAFESSSNLSRTSNTSTESTTTMSSWLSPVLPLLSSARGRTSATTATVTRTLTKPQSPQPASSHHIVLQSLQITVLLWVTSMLLGMVVFLYQILPRNAFNTLVVMTLSSGLFLLLLWSQGTQYIHTLTASDDSTGLAGAWLSPNLYHIWTHTSLHEYLTRRTTHHSDWRFLLLYVLPLTEQQLNQLLNRLTRQHRRQLHRPGLWHWILPDSALTLAVGPRGVRAMTTTTTTPTQHQRRSALRQPTPVIEMEPQQQFIMEEEDDDDDGSSASDLGLDISVDDLEGGAAGTQLARRLGLSAGDEEEEEPSTIMEESFEDGNDDDHDDNEEAHDDDEDNDDDAINENDVLLDAMWDSAVSMVWTLTVQSVRPMIWPILTGGFGVASLMSLANWWRRPSPYSPWRGTRTSTNWSTDLVLFGSTTSIVLLAMAGNHHHYYHHRRFLRGPIDQDKSSSTQPLQQRHVKQSDKNNEQKSLP